MKRNNDEYSHGPWIDLAFADSQFMIHNRSLNFKDRVGTLSKTEQAPSIGHCHVRVNYRRQCPDKQTC